MAISYSFFYKNDTLCFCKDVEGLFGALGCHYDPQEWRLFIDSSCLSLKAVLLHNGNMCPSIPVGHAVHMKETYDTIKLLLSSIQYSKHNWNLCGDLKVVALLVGMQLGYTKYCCFICEWDSRARDSHYIKKDWPRRKRLVPGQRTFITNHLLIPVRFSCHLFTSSLD